MGGGLAELHKEKKWLFYVTLLITSAFMLRSSWYRINEPSWEEMRPVVNTLCEEAEGEDKIYVHSWAMPAFDFYWRRCKLSSDHRWSLNDSSSLKNNVYFGEKPEVLEEIIEEKVWIVISHASESERDEILSNLVAVNGREPFIYKNARGVWLYIMEAE